MRYRADPNENNIIGVPLAPESTDRAPLAVVSEEATPPSVQAPPGWDATVLAFVQAQFVNFMGPIGKAIVLLAAKQTTDIDELYAKLADQIDVEEERETFNATRAHLVAPAR